MAAATATGAGGESPEGDPTPGGPEGSAAAAEMELFCQYGEVAHAQEEEPSGARSMSEAADSHSGAGAAGAMEPEPAAGAPAMAAWIPYPLQAIPAGRRRLLPAFPLRPRRRVIVPAHRARPCRRLPLAGAVAMELWPQPVSPEEAARGPGGRASMARSAWRGSGSAAVVVFSFLEGPGPASGAPEAFWHAPRQAGGARQPAEGVQPLAELGEGPASWPELRRGRRAAPKPLPLAGKDRLKELAPRCGLRLLGTGLADLWSQQAASIQPYRLHRMPMRALRLRPLMRPRAGAQAAPPALVRLALLEALHVPRVVALPVRPTYRWMPAGAAPATGAPAEGVQAPMPLAGSASPRHGG